MVPSDFVFIMSRHVKLTVSASTKTVGHSEHIIITSNELLNLVPMTRGKERERKRDEEMERKRDKEEERENEKEKEKEGFLFMI